VIAAEVNAEKQLQLEQVVFKSNMSGVAEDSDLFYELLAAKCNRMQWCRALVVEAMGALGDASGFDAWERALIVVRCTALLYTAPPTPRVSPAVLWPWE
jgi:hypothetical protein